MESDYVEVQYSLQQGQINVGPGAGTPEFEYHMFAAKEVITVDTHTCRNIVVCLCITDRHDILFVTCNTNTIL